MYQTLDDLLDRDTVASARQRLQALPASDWADGRDSAGPQARNVKSNLQLPHGHPLATELRETVGVALHRTPLFLSAALPLKLLTPRINRYDPEHPAYGWHVDNAVRLRSDGEHVRADLSCTVFLNDPDEYEGGELVIADGEVEHQIKLAAGSAVLYRGHTLHQVRPVVSGMRLACFLWVQSLVPGDTERDILHSLDMALVSLRQRHGETEEATSLTAVYHRLLRLWART